MALQYFHFEKPQKIKVHDNVDNVNVRYERVALGYWQDTEEPYLDPHFNLARGQVNSSGWPAYISANEVNS